MDLRPLPLRRRKAMLARVGEGAEGWIALTNGIIGEGRALYQAVVDADLEGIVAKHLDDVYHPKFAGWHKGLNRAYTQRRGRVEWFRERQGRRPGLPMTIAQRSFISASAQSGGPNLHERCEKVTASSGAVC